MDLILETLGKLGGVGAIIFGLSAVLGKLWSNRILAREKVLYEEKIEYLKHNLTIVQENITRFSEKQFDYYMSLWSSLQDLRFSGKELWEEANKEKLIKFSKTLYGTDKLVEKSRLFLEQNHYKELREVLHTFKNFEFGKIRLIELREGNEYLSDEWALTSQNISMQINSNRVYKEKYEALLENVGRSLRNQMKGKSFNELTVGD
jgi:hypothetical protein